MNFNQFAFSKFGNFVRQHKGYLDMKMKLRSAQIFMPYDEYVSIAIAITLAVAVIGLFLGLLIGMFVFTRIDIPHITVYDPNIAKILMFFSPFKKIWIVIFGIIFSLIIGGIVYTLVMVFPSLQASVRKVQIDTQLPFVVTYMYALSRGETNIVEIMRSVAELPNVYGEIAIEFKKILRDIELLGTDFMTALRNLQKETPSPELSQFLGNMLTIIDNGGDVSDFLTLQIENYRTKTKSQHTVFLDMLAMIAESYVTGFVAGPLFMIIIAVTLGSMQSSMTMLLLVLTYAIIPLGSFGFIFIVDIMLPKDEQVIGDLKLRKVREFTGLRMAKIPPGDERKLFEDYEKEKKWIHFKTILKNPTRALFDEPVLSLYITVPVALIVLAIPILSDSAPLFRGYIEASNYLTNYILLSAMIILVPYIVFFESRSRKILKIETAISHFLKHLSIINETGLPLSESLRIMLHTDIGPLRAHIEKMYTDMKWGSGVGEAFIRFANKIKVNMLSRTVALVTKASESSGDITDVLNIAATDSNISAQLKEEKRTNMFIYIIIIYTAFLVFLYVVYSLTTTFLPPMAKASQGGGATFIKNFDLEFYKVYFYHTALVQGFFSGMMAGVLGEGNPRSGLKHSLVMMLIGFVVFKLLV